MVFKEQQRTLTENIKNGTKLSDYLLENTRPNSSSNKVNVSGTPKSTNEEAIDGRRKMTVLENHGYVLGKVIGIGSYATVKIATSARHGCKVAVKVVSKIDAPADYLKKFLPREIQVVKGLRHPNLIRFLQAIETTHRVYIIMEYAEKGSLLDVIQREGFIDEPRAKNWFRQLVAGIDYCHQRGVVHRDIKCENLLIDADYNIKLSDFGFARGQMRCKTGHQQPLSDTFCGSYAYASPEILKGVPYTPHQSDVWSMGVVLYAMLFGRLPFDDTNYIHLLKQVQSKIVFPSEPVVSTECKALLSKIFTNIKLRICMEDIKQDLWLQMDISSTASEAEDDIKDTVTDAGKGTISEETK